MDFFQAIFTPNWLMPACMAVAAVPAAIAFRLHIEILRNAQNEEDRKFAWRGIRTGLLIATVIVLGCTYSLVRALQ